jgi:hypothetical protein
VHAFPTGQGNITGNPIAPVIKITGNRMTICDETERAHNAADTFLHRPDPARDRGTVPEASFGDPAYRQRRTARSAFADGDGPSRPTS